MEAGALAVSGLAERDTTTLVNDIHSQLNATRVDAVVRPRDLDELTGALALVREAGKSVAIAGGRHAMGGQQFAEASVLVDTRALDRVLEFDTERGLVTVEGGILWPALIEYLDRVQQDQVRLKPDTTASTVRLKPDTTAPTRQWGIIQKQTGADRLSLAGALSCNAHGRGLALKPIVDQVEAFDLLDHAGCVRTCSRRENPELFRLAIGGYGLFGLITRVQLRLRPRVKVQRIVTLGETGNIIERFEDRIRDGYLYGDFQFATDSSRESFLQRGVFSCYRPVEADTPLTQNPTRFHPEDWARLTYYSHKNKRLAFDVYTSRYLATSGQIYWADSQLSAAYVDHYHADLDRALHARVKGSEMITEIYVDRARLAQFMTDAGRTLRDLRANVIYGTVRLTERDDETFLAWARDRFACIIFNLHVDHTPQDIERAAEAFRALIDLGIRHGGSYYLTYHRWARKDQVERCYPQLPEFLRLKRKYDPDEFFESNWYRHYRDMFASQAPEQSA
jgi:FAD/FMN-containing dehydrogenase